MRFLIVAAAFMLGGLWFVSREAKSPPPSPPRVTVASPSSPSRLTVARRADLSGLRAQLGREQGDGPRFPVRLSGEDELEESSNEGSGTDIGQEIIQIEYFVSKNTSIVATRDETGSLGLDIKHRTRF